MARRRKTSIIEDLVEITTRLPWWVGCMLAVISFAVLHHIAGTKPAKPTGLENMGAAMGQQMRVTFAMFGQIILPAVFGFGALFSLIKQRGQKVGVSPSATEPCSTREFRQSPPRLLSTAPQTINDLLKEGIGPKPQIAGQAPPQEWSLPVLASLEWKRFETVCAEYLRIVGYNPRETRIGADGGVDIWVYKDGSERPVGIVQCKAWKTYKVGVKPVRELYGVMASERVANGKFITSGEFTTEALQFAEGKTLELISGETFLNWIRKLAPEKQRQLLEIALAGDYRTPTCPRCGVKMAVRQGGESKKFWGCPGFPSCRATLVYKDHEE